MSWALCVSVEAGKFSSIHLDVILHEFKKNIFEKNEQKLNLYIQ